MHDEDYLYFRKFEEIYIRQLSQTANDFVKDEFQEHSLCREEVIIAVEVDSQNLAKGEIRISAEHYLSFGEVK